MKKVLITGVGSGIGYALAEKYLEEGVSVYAIGRDAPPLLDKHPAFFFFPYDLSKTFLLKAEVSEFIAHHHFDLAILNAGILGEIKPLKETMLEEIKEVMEVNLWANKELIDALDAHGSVDQVVAISSATSRVSMKGWGAYSLSKSALNTLIDIYAKELPHIHFSAIAPGFIRTPMTEYLLGEVDRKCYPSIEELAHLPIISAQQAAALLLKSFKKLKGYESGSFVDITKP